MSDHLVRVGKLKDLQRANGWNDADLARNCGRSQQQVYSWFNNDRKIGERLARSLEQKLGLSRYALDDRPGTSEAVLHHLQAGDGTPLAVASLSQLSGVTKRPRDLPVISWDEISSMLEVENASIRGKSRTLETYAISSEKAKFIEMLDDSMSSDIQPGDHLLFDPQEAPRAGDIVLVRSGAEYFVRMFRPRTAYVFEAVPLNANYQPLTSTDDGLFVAGVMVEHRKYRRR